MNNTDVEKSNRRIIGIDESKYICCCGCHVISCAKFFSILSIVLSAIILLSSLFTPSYYFYANFQFQSSGFQSKILINISKGNVVVYCVIDGVLKAGVLYGIYRIKPAALLPYIIVKTIFLIIFGLFTIIGLITVTVMIFTGHATELGVFVWIIVGALGLFFIECLLFYMFYRAYKYLKEVKLGRYARVDQMQNVPTYK